MKLALTSGLGTASLLLGFVAQQITTTTNALYARLCVYSIFFESVALIFLATACCFSKGTILKPFLILLIAVAGFIIYQATRWLVTGLSSPIGIAVVTASVPDGSSTWTLLLLSLAATFGLKPLLRRPA